ncbi:MAG TPA: penicillin-binding protein, partial [Microlunatus sp.]
DDFARPGDSTFFGGTYPALTWVDYMQTAVEDLPVKEFKEPAYVNRDSAPQPTVTSRSDPTRTQGPTTEAPTQAPTTEAPTKRPTTEAPTQDPTTEGATGGPTDEPSGGG